MTRGKTAFLLVTVFLSGAAVMVVEMTAVRILEPTFGATTYVWTNVIAVVLAALAVGYAVGGRIADKRASPALLYGTLAVGGLLVAATAPLATPLSLWLLPVDVNLENVPSFLMKGSLAATTILFAPSTMLLGMISPMAIRLLSESGVGRAAGRVFALSTVGSIVGTYLPTLWLVPEYGSRKTILFAAAMLVAPAVVGLVLCAGRRGAPLAAVALGGRGAVRAGAELRPARPAPKMADGTTAQVLAEVESPYQYLSVRENRVAGDSPKSEKWLTINESVFTYHSVEVAGSVLTGHKYYDDYALLPLLLDIPQGEELRGAIVGLACGVTANQWRHFWDGLYKLHVDGAEIDPEVIRLGREFFHLPGKDATWLTAQPMDGRQMLLLEPASTTYHMIVVDAFSQELYIPFHLGTREFFELCKRRLAPGGVLAMNVYAARPDSPDLAALANTLASVFGECRRVQQWWYASYLLIATNAPGGADMTRFLPRAAAARFGKRADVPEWDTLIEYAAWLPEHATVVRPDDAIPVLTDDHCPLEAMTDRFIAREEEKFLGR